MTAHAERWSPEDAARENAREGLTRRAALGTAAALWGASLLQPAVTDADSRSVPAPPALDRSAQGGITTAPQQHMLFGAFDLTGHDLDDLRALMKTWSDVASKLNAGAQVPGDSDEAAELGTAATTITFGFGPTLFSLDGEDRLGLEHLQPSSLRPLPPFPTDHLDPERCGGDLCIQVCSNDQQVAFHALRALMRAGRGAAAPRWMQTAFRPSQRIATGTPRNLLGFRDGTHNIDPADGPALRQHVWVGPGDSPPWLVAGTLVVVRRISVDLAAWDQQPDSRQSQIIGRIKRSGAPLGGHHEFDPVMRSRLPTSAHIGLASPENNGGARLLRRSYGFSDGLDTGELDAGLFFVAFQRDIDAQFVAIQRTLASNDALNAFVRHTGSGAFAIPPAAPRDGFIGQGLIGE
jgi:deferrochelatase/peroxidase EfeB